MVRIVPLAPPTKIDYILCDVIWLPDPRSPKSPQYRRIDTLLDLFKVTDEFIEEFMKNGKKSLEDDVYSMILENLRLKKKNEKPLTLREVLTWKKDEFRFYFTLAAKEFDYKPYGMKGITKKWYNVSDILSME